MSRYWGLSDACGPGGRSVGVGRSRGGRLADQCRLERKPTLCFGVDLGLARGVAVRFEALVLLGRGSSQEVPGAREDLPTGPGQGVPLVGHGRPGPRRGDADVVGSEFTLTRLRSERCGSSGAVLAAGSVTTA